MKEVWSKLVVLCILGTTLQAAENASTSVLTKETILVTFKDGQGYYPKAVIEQLPLYEQLVEDLGQDRVTSFPLEATSIRQEHFEHIAWSKVYFTYELPVALRQKATAYKKDFNHYSPEDVIKLFEAARKLLECKPLYNGLEAGQLSKVDEVTSTIGSYLHREVFAKNPQKTFALMTKDQFDEMNQIWADGLDVGYFESEKIFALSADGKLIEEPIPDLSQKFIYPYVRYVQRFLHSHETAANIRMRTGAPVYQTQDFKELSGYITSRKTISILLRWIVTVYGADMVKQQEGCLDNVFAQAVESRNSRLVAVLIAAGVDVDQQLACGYGFRGLLSAAYNGDLEMVDLLLKAKAQVDLVDDTNNTPLMMAVDSHHKPENCEKIVQLLLAAQANPKLKNSVQDTALSRASYFGYVNVVQALIVAGAELDSCNMYGSTPLIAASSQGHTAVVAALLTAGARKDLADNLERKAIDHARMEKHDAIVDLLQAGEDAGESESLGIGQQSKKNTGCLIL